MRQFLFIFLFLIIGVALGAVFTQLERTGKISFFQFLPSSLQTNTQQKLTEWTKIHNGSQNPYSYSHRVSRGELPSMPESDSEYLLKYDSQGRLLSGNCLYSLKGYLPQIPIWTLTATSLDNQGTPKFGQKQSINSAVIQYDPMFKFTISISKQIPPGNWLGLAENVENFELNLKLYGSLISKGFQQDQFNLPQLQLISCQLGE